MRAYRVLDVTVSEEGIEKEKTRERIYERHKNKQ